MDMPDWSDPSEWEGDPPEDDDMDIFLELFGVALQRMAKVYKIHREAKGDSWEEMTLGQLRSLLFYEIEEYLQANADSLEERYELTDVMNVGLMVLTKLSGEQPLTGKEQGMMPLTFIIEEPRYTHDSEEDEYLGQYQEYDLYVDRLKDGRIKTVVARSGSEGPEYISGLVHISNNGPLAVAYLRANADTIDVSIQIDSKADPITTETAGLPPVPAEESRKELDELQSESDRHAWFAGQLRKKYDSVHIVEQELDFVQLAELAGQTVDTDCLAKLRKELEGAVLSRGYDKLNDGLSHMGYFTGL